MGLFNYVKFTANCPTCNKELTEFQTKDNWPCMETIEFYECENFYDLCDCGTCVEYTYNPELKKQRRIEDYQMSARQEDEWKKK